MTYPGVAPPPIDPRLLRPKRAWCGVAAAIAVLGVVGGIIGLVIVIRSFGSLAEAIPPMVQRFDGASPATVQLTADKQWAVYVRDTQLAVTCTGRAVDGGTIELVDPTYTFTTSSAGVTWYLLYEVSVSQNGQYEISCPAENLAFAVGEAPDVGGMVGAIFGSVGGIFVTLGVPCIGVATAGVIILVTALRRNSHRNRLRPPAVGPPR